MSEQEKAMDLIRDELAKAGDNPGLAVLGEYLTERLRADPGIAAAVLKLEKPIKSGFDAIRDHARKIARGGCAVVDDRTGFGIACKKWGIPEDGEKNPAPIAAPAMLVQAQAPARDDFDLDALLGVSG